MTPRLYRRRGGLVEAMQVPDPDDLQAWGELAGWFMVNGDVDYFTIAGPDCGCGVDGLLLHTGDGDEKLDIGDWVIRRENGDLSWLSADDFARFYEEVSDA